MRIWGLREGEEGGGDGGVFSLHFAIRSLFADKCCNQGMILADGGVFSLLVDIAAMNPLHSILQSPIYFFR